MDNRYIFEKTSFSSLLAALSRKGYDIIGPTVQDRAIVYDRIGSVDDLPEGWTDEQGAGRYRLKKRSDKALFGYAVGPASWKKFLFPSNEKLWEGERRKNNFEITHKHLGERGMKNIKRLVLELIFHIL